MKRLNLSLEQLKKKKQTNKKHQVVTYMPFWIGTYYNDCAVPYVRNFHTGYGIFHCAPMKYAFMLHLMTMKYVISHMRMPHGTAQSLYYLYHYAVIESCSFIKFLREGRGITEIW